MPIAPISKTTAVSPPPEASSQESVRERRFVKGAADRSRHRPRRPPEKEKDDEAPQTDGHIDVRA
jgi:hypothetical protein